MRLSPEQLSKAQAHGARVIEEREVKRKRKPSHIKGQWNENERRYFAWYLDRRDENTDIEHVEFEGQTFYLAFRCQYTPDFRVIRSNGKKEYHEVKGPCCRDDSRVKFKVASRIYPDALFIWAKWDPKKFEYKIERWKDGGRVK